MVQLLNVPNALAGSNWGQTAGQNIAQGMQLRREQEQKNALAAALPGALSGDTNALASVYGVSPEMGLKVQQYNATRQDAADKLKRDQLELKRGRFYDTLAGSIASVAALPKEQQDAAWKTMHANIASQFPEFDDGQGEDSWATAQSHAPALAMLKKEYADVLGRFGVIPPEPMKEQGIQNVSPGGALVDPKTGKVIFQADFKPDAPQRETWGIPQTVDGPNGPVLIRTSNLGGVQEVPGYAPKPNAQQATLQKQSADKLRTVGLIRTQLDKVKSAWDEIQKGGTFDAAGPIGGRIPSPSGEKFDAAVALLSPLIRQLTRVPGEGAQSDYESKLAQAAVPNRKNFNDATTAQQIQSYYDLLDTMQGLYGGPSQDPAASVQAAPASSAPATTLPAGWKITKVK